MTRDLRSTTVVPLVLGAAHALVDLACAFVLFRDLNVDEVAPITVATWIIAYDALAFVAQAPFGLLVDRLRAYRSVALVGIVAVVVALAIGPSAPKAASVLAGVGNALYHVGAGGHVLRACGPGARGIGLFVGPGAIGLCIGILWGAGQVPYRMPIAAALVAILVAAAWAMPQAEASGVALRHGVRPRPARVVGLCLGLLLATVTLRSTIGDNVVEEWRGRSVAIVVALAITATLGKMVGGLLADRLGWIRVGGAALFVAAPVIALGRLSPFAAVAGMLLLQTTTPLTLKAIHELLPDRPALAFGIPSAALFVGAAPGLVSVWLFPAWPALLVATLLSAVSVIVGLRSLGDRSAVG